MNLSLSQQSLSIYKYIYRERERGGLMIHVYILFFTTVLTNKQMGPSPLSLKLLFIISSSYCCFFILSHGGEAEYDLATTTTNIGAIINSNSRIGKQQKIAMAIAVQNFNNNKSINHKLSLHFQNSAGIPLQAAEAALGLIKEKQVQVIIGLESWEETAFVADVGTQAKVPILSFATAAITPKLAPLRWPFLVQMAANTSEQIDCIVDIFKSYHWQKVITIFEEDMHGWDSGMFTLFSKALQNIGSQIEYNLVFPPFSLLSEPKEFIEKELMKFQSTESRVFIILQSSLPLTTLLFKEAKRLGFMKENSGWIITDKILSLLNTSVVVSSMEGVLGTKAYYSETSNSFNNFSVLFREKFESEYPEENNLEPGIHALRAYDSITTMTEALKGFNHNITSTRFLEGILSSNFSGLSGEIHFEEGRLSQPQIFTIVNVFDKKTSYKNGSWSRDSGFLENIIDNDENGKHTMRVLLADSTTCPVQNTEWVKPSAENPLKIAVPATIAFEQFVKIGESKNPDEKYTGYCFDVFREIQKMLNYELYANYVDDHGNYNDLIDKVANKTYDAIVGDLTILADRSKKVEFSEPFTESGLSFIIPLKPQTPKAWIFVKPFTWEMWAATGGMLMYTMFVVWFLEHRSNPEFGGIWKDQLRNSLWFTFSTLFFVQKERIESNLTRVVVVVWLFVVLILTQSYTASLSSMLTVSRLNSDVTSIEELNRTNANIGCDDSTFIWEYLVKQLKFKAENIKNISNEYEYLDAFEKGTISAAFLEIPYARVFVNKYCKKYRVVGSTYRFGGFGFVFQNNSGIVADVSDAILRLSENGKLKELEEKLFTPSSECSVSINGEDSNSLSIESFLGLYIISGATSTICFLFFLIRLLKNYRHHQENSDIIISEEEEEEDKNNNNNVWGKIVRLAHYLNNEEEIRVPPPRDHQDLKYYRYRKATSSKYP